MLCVLGIHVDRCCCPFAHITQQCMQARTTLQQRLDTAELDRENGRKHSSSLQAQVDALQNRLNQVQGYHNQATKDLQVLLQAVLPLYWIVVACYIACPGQHCIHCNWSCCEQICGHKNEIVVVILPHPQL